VKGKLFTIRWVVVLILIGILAGAGAGRALPTLLGKDSASLVSAAELSVNPAAPLAPLTPTGSGFTYQGSLKSGGNPATGNYDFAFHLFDDPTSGSQVGTPITLTNQIVTAGLFTVSLDFGSSVFDGNARYMEISVRQSGGGGYTTLSPRQPITPTPYALFALKTAPYKNVIVVAQSGGQFTSITAALNSITDNSSTNRYLIYVAPGTYTETVSMKQWVDIEGAGEKATRITFTGSTNGDTGTVVGASNAELRSLTVANTGVNNYAIAIYNSGASPSLLHVTATASGGGSVNYAVVNYTSSSPNMANVTATASGGANNDGVVNNASSPNMTDVTATASGGSVDNYAVNNNNASSPTMTNVIATASGGSYSDGVINNTSSPKIVGSSINASGGATNYGLYDYNSSVVTIDSSKITVPLADTTIYNYQSTARVGASLLSGGPVSNSFGTLNCTASYDENYVSPGLNVCP
jgi:hypothetical protein